MNEKEHIKEIRVVDQIYSWNMKSHNFTTRPAHTKANNAWKIDWPSIPEEAMEFFKRLGCKPSLVNKAESE